MAVFGYPILNSIDFYDFVSPFFLASIETLYQTLKTVSHHISSFYTSFNPLLDPCLDKWSNTVFRV